MTKIKICGLTRAADVDAVNAARPDYCGFVIEVPGSRRSVTPQQARSLRARLGSRISPVGVFVDAPPELVASLLRDGVICMAQLHGGEDGRYLAALRRLSAGPVMQAFRVGGAEDLRRAAASGADCVLLDSGAGSGKPFDWSLLGGFPRPCFLAGGLGPDNLEQAIRAVTPYGVDMSSGVETDGRKDREKIFAAVAAVRRLGNE